ncbi:MAG TPA: sulfatase-like hydrolase/transferase [Planctomycetota bacterium]|nr:sulfatase-like hydrolase/transferase [Planctomycetota bacterium]
MPTPNLLLLFSDQQRPDTMGCYGQALPTTPRLDRLAAEGVRFTDAFTNQPVCGPARATLQTGRYPTEIGCWRNELALPPDEATLATLLGGAGYETMYVGKWHLAAAGAGPVPRERRGGYQRWLASDLLEFTSHGHDGWMFDEHDRRVDFTGVRAHAVADAAVAMLRERDATRPFFQMVSWIEPHHQNDRGRYEGPLGSRERWGGYAAPADLEPGVGDWQREYPDYLGCVNAVDDGVGRILDELARQGIADDTLVIYASDHGNHFRTRNGEYKRSCHDASLRIPLIARGPGFAGGRTCPRFAATIDLAPTLLAAARVPLPPTLRGRPLQAALTCAGWRDQGACWRDEVVVQISESCVGRALRDKRWTYGIVAPDRDGWDHGDATLYREEFLYDCVADPAQRRNLVVDPSFAAVRANLAARLRARLTAIGEPPFAIVGAAVGAAS